jgi:hypothetical protein
MRAAVLGVAFDTVPDRLPRRGILFLPLPAATLAKNDRRATCGDVTTFSAVAPCSGRRAHPSIQCSESPPNMITQHHLRLRQSCDPPKILPLCVLFATVSSNSCTSSAADPAPIRQRNHLLSRRRRLRERPVEKATRQRGFLRVGSISAAKLSQTQNPKYDSKGFTDAALSVPQVPLRRGYGAVQLLVGPFAGRSGAMFGL